MNIREEILQGINLLNRRGVFECKNQDYIDMKLAEIDNKKLVNIEMLIKQSQEDLKKEYEDIRSKRME